MQKENNGILDRLSEEEKEALCEVAVGQRIIDVVQALRKRNIKVSVATVSRFLRRQREKRLLDEGEDMKEAVEGLANRGSKDALRKGTFEAVRQRLYEQALSMENAEGMTKLFETLMKEETRLKELELEARRTAVAEENLKIQRQRLQIDAFKTAMKHIPEALRILCDEKLEDKLKIVEARRCLAQASTGARAPEECASAIAVETSGGGEKAAECG